MIRYPHGMNQAGSPESSRLVIPVFRLVLDLPGEAPS